MSAKEPTPVQFYLAGLALAVIGILLCGFLFQFYAMQGLDIPTAFRVFTGMMFVLGLVTINVGLMRQIYLYGLAKRRHAAVCEIIEQTCGVPDDMMLQVAREVLGYYYRNDVIGLEIMARRLKDDG